jgi:hypothetical protein
LNYIVIKTTVQTPKPQTETQEQTSSKTPQTNPAKQAGNQTTTKTNSQQDRKIRENKPKPQDTSIWNLRQKRLINIPALTETNVFLGLLKLSFPCNPSSRLPDGQLQNLLFCMRMACMFNLISYSPNPINNRTNSQSTDNTKHRFGFPASAAFHNQSLPIKTRTWNIATLHTLLPYSSTETA